MIILRQKEFARKKGKKDVDYLKEALEKQIELDKEAEIENSYMTRKLSQPIDRKTRRAGMYKTQDTAIHNARRDERGGMEFVNRKGMKMVKRISKLSDPDRGFHVYYENPSSLKELEKVNNDRKEFIRERLSPKSIEKAKKMKENRERLEESSKMYQKQAQEMVDNMNRDIERKVEEGRRKRAEEARREQQKKSEEHLEKTRKGSEERLKDSIKHESLSDKWKKLGKGKKAAIIGIPVATAAIGTGIAIKKHHDKKKKEEE
jgi:hypothetical protein